MAFQLTITAGHLRRVLTLLLALLLIAAICGLIALLLRPSDPFDDTIHEDRYQAVTLDDGTIYFAQVDVASDDFYRLENAQLIRTDPATKAAKPGNHVEPLSSQLLLGEPAKEVLVSREHVILIADLKKSSRVAAAIRKSS